MPYVQVPARSGEPICGDAGDLSGYDSPVVRVASDGERELSLVQGVRDFRQRRDVELCRIGRSIVQSVASAP